MEFTEFGKSMNEKLNSIEFDLMNITDNLKRIRESLIQRVMQEYRCSREVAEQMMKDVENGKSSA